MHYIFKCQTCNRSITSPVKLIKTAREMKLYCKFDQKFEGKDTPVPKGYALEFDEETREFLKSYPSQPSPLAHHWLNLEDISPEVGLVKDLDRLNGCCGLDGSSGANRICQCGTEIGTERSDCWTYQIFIPLSESVELREC